MGAVLTSSVAVDVLAGKFALIPDAARDANSLITVAPREDKRRGAIAASRVGLTTSVVVAIITPASAIYVPL